MNDSKREELIELTKIEIIVLEEKLAHKRNYRDRHLMELTGKRAMCTNYQCEHHSSQGDLNCSHKQHNKKRYISRCDCYKSELF